MSTYYACSEAKKHERPTAIVLPCMKGLHCMQFCTAHTFALGYLYGVDATEGEPASSDVLRGGLQDAGLGAALRLPRQHLLHMQPVWQLLRERILASVWCQAVRRAAISAMT